MWGLTGADCRLSRFFSHFGYTAVTVFRVDESEGGRCCTSSNGSRKPKQRSTTSVCHFIKTAVRLNTFLWAVSSHIQCWPSKDIKNESIFIIQCFPISERAPLFWGEGVGEGCERSQSSSICISGENNVYMTMSRDTDWQEEPEVLGQKAVLVSLRSTQNSYWVTSNRNRCSALTGR
jgi:hypothetical protein